MSGSEEPWKRSVRCRKGIALSSHGSAWKRSAAEPLGIEQQWKCFESLATELHCTVMEWDGQARDVSSKRVEEQGSALEPIRPDLLKSRSDPTCLGDALIRLG